MPKPETTRIVGKALRDMLDWKAPEDWTRVMRECLERIKADDIPAPATVEPGFDILADGLTVPARLFGALAYAEREGGRLLYYQIPRDRLAELEAVITPPIKLFPDAEGWVGRTNGVPIRVGDCFEARMVTP